MAHVLVVEDSDVVRGAIADVLRGAGHEVSEASNGADALDRMAEQRPDVIVLDLMMPALDGWAFAERCRQPPLNAEVPIIVASASHNLHRAAEQLRPLGVRACLAKPFDIDALVAMVAQFS